MIFCPMTKHLSQFRDNTLPPRVVSNCRWYDSTWAQGRRRVGLGIWGGSVFLQRHLPTYPQSGLFSRVGPLISAGLFLIPKYKVPAAATHVFKGHGLICCYTGVNLGGGVGGDLWSQVQKNCSLVGKLTLAPFIISTNLGPPLHPTTDTDNWHFLNLM